MAWHWMDYAILVVIGLSVLTGLFRGFLKELIALCVWVLAIWLAFYYTESVEHWLLPYFHEETLRKVTAFIAILLTTLIIGGLLNILLGLLIARSGLSGTDRILGMGFGFIRGVFIVALVMLVIQFTSLPYETYAQTSRLYAKFTPVVSWLSGFVPQFVHQVKAYDSNEFMFDIEPSP